MAWSGTLTAGTLTSQGDISFGAIGDVAKSTVAITLGTHTTGNIAHGLGAVPDFIKLTVTAKDVAAGAATQQLIPFVAVADATNIRIGAVSVGDNAANQVTTGTIRVLCGIRHSIVS